MSSTRHPYRGEPTRRQLSAQAALGIILACAVGVAACLLAMGWMLCSQAQGTALCTLAVPALPVRHALRRHWLRWLMWRNSRRMAETERRIAQYRRLLADDQYMLEVLRSELCAQQSRQLVLASEQ